MERTKRVTAADVARASGLSRATVGFVLNNTPGQTIPEATRDRVIAEAKRLGYRPHQAARALASGRSGIILLVMPDWPLDHSVRSHLDQASRTLDDAGYSLVTMTLHDQGHAAPLWETLSPEVVVAFTADTLTPAQQEEVRRSGARLALPRPAWSEDPAAGMAYALGPQMQVAHLHGRGRRSLAFAGSTDQRLAELVAHRRELAHAHLVGLDAALPWRAASIDSSTASEVVSQWLADGVDGVVAYNDDVAALTIRAAVRAGARVPDDLAVIGHDDTPLAELFLPSITSIAVDTTGVGHYLATLAIDVASDLDPATHPPAISLRLVPREST